MRLIKRTGKRRGWAVTLAPLLAGIALATVWVNDGGGTPAEAVLWEVDPDLAPEIATIHTPPMVAPADEVVHLKFLFVCGVLPERGAPRCSPEPTLYAAWGNEPVAVQELRRVVINGLPQFEADLPVARARGHLSYHVDVTAPSFGLSARYPVTGELEPFVAATAHNVPLAEAAPPSDYQTAARLAWGEAPNQVGVRWSSEGATVGPDAFDVDDQGVIYLLDEVNRRVLVVGPSVSRSLAVPLHDVGDVRVADDGSIAVLDAVGSAQADSHVRIPQLRRYNQEGQLEATAPVYVRLIQRLEPDGMVTDNGHTAGVRPLTAAGVARNRASQRATRALPELSVRWVDHQNAYLADTARQHLFRLATSGELGAVALFDRTASGYVAAFETEDGFRLVWLSPSGRVLAEASAPSEQIHEINPMGRVRANSAGDVYIMNSDTNGLVIIQVAAPLWSAGGMS